MSLFSERYGYTKPSEVIIRERITPEIQNAICSCYDKLESENDDFYRELEKYTWTNFLNERENNFYNILGYGRTVSTQFIEDEKQYWFRKLDLIEFSISHMANENMILCDYFIYMLNSEFERLNFVYRLVENKIVDITSKEEIKTIENAIEKSENNVAKHLSKALEQYALRPQGDYQNSIKESISAVEAYLREKTGELTLGKALKKLEEANIFIPQKLKTAFEKLYAYTNHEETGIRHALMDREGNYVPTEREAYFMLVSCSAFINYLQGK